MLPITISRFNGQSRTRHAELKKKKKKADAYLRIRRITGKRSDTYDPDDTFPGFCADPIDNKSISRLSHPTCV